MKRRKIIFTASIFVLLISLAILLILIIPKFRKKSSVNDTSYSWDHTLKGLLTNDDCFMFNGITANTDYSKLSDDLSQSTEQSTDNRKLTYGITFYDSRSFTDINTTKTAEYYFFSSTTNKIQSVQIILTPNTNDEIKQFNDSIAFYFQEHFSKFIKSEDSSWKDGNNINYKGRQIYQDTYGNNIVVEYGPGITITVQYTHTISTEPLKYKLDIKYYTCQNGFH